MRQDLKAICAAVSLFLAVLGSPKNLAAVDFAAAKSYAVGTSPAAIVVADFDGDGKVDIAVANAGGGDVSVLLGNGDGTFQPAMNFSTGNSPSAIAIGDFNDDGKLDLAVLQPGANGVAGSVSILLGNGNGSFQAPKTLALNETASFMAVADFNLDKKSDLAVGDAAGLNVFIGNGDGTFQAAKLTVLSSQGSGIVTADLNGDAKPDAAVVTSSGIQILLGNGDGTFSQGVLLTTPGTLHGVPIVYESAVAADLNHDGKVDLLVNTAQIEICCTLPHDSVDTSIFLFLGNGDGSFQREQVVVSSTQVVAIFTMGDQIGYPFVGDFNGDGKMDLGYAAGANLLMLPFIHTSNDNSLIFLLGKGDGSFSSPVTGVALPGNVKPITKGLNGDKLDDLILAGTTNNIEVLLNTSPTSGTDLGILSLAAAPIPGLAGTDLTFTADVLNQGPQDATGVTFMDTLPNGVNFVSATATPGSCVQANGIVNCSIGALPSAFNSKVSVIVTPTAVGTITNTMNVTGHEPDLVPSNNSATQTATIASLVTLTVTDAGKGAGTVTANLGAINCGSTCSGNYAQGTSVSLTATPATGSAFSSWSGACTGSDPNTCTIVMNSAQSVTATFSLASDFTLVSASTSFAMRMGMQVTDTLTLTGQNAFSGQVNLNCTVSGPAPMATCGVSPPSVTLGSDSGKSTLTITAPGSLTALAVHENVPHTIATYAGILPVPAVLLGVIGLLSLRLKKRGIGLCLLGSGAFAFCVVLAGCGGGSAPPPTPKNYTVTVNAMSATGSNQHSTVIEVTVQ